MGIAVEVLNSASVLASQSFNAASAFIFRASLYAASSLHNPVASLTNGLDGQGVLTGAYLEREIGHGSADVNVEKITRIHSAKDCIMKNGMRAMRESKLKQ